MELEELIQVFRAENTSELDNEDDSAKPGIVESVTDMLPNATALEFLIEVASSRTEFDLARIEALRGIELADGLTETQRAECSSMLVTLLTTADEDPDVCNYAAMASAYFMDSDSVYQTLLDLVVNETRDSNLRWNAFTAVEKHKPQQKSIETLKSLLTDTEFQTSATRVLAEWGAG